MRLIDADALIDWLKKAGRYVKGLENHKPLTEIIGKIIDHIANMRTIDPESLRPKWIPVTERLPDPFQTVLTYEAKHDTIQEAYITNHKEWVGVIISGSVTHWKERSTPKEDNHESD